MKLKRKIIYIMLTIAMSLSITSTAFADEKGSAPDITAKAAVAIDASTGEIIYSKNLDAREYPASTTKLLTALILTETKKPSDILTYTTSAKNQPSASLNVDKKSINVGEKITAKNALSGMLIYSANDIAYMIADNIVGKPNDNIKDTNTDFSLLMNKEVTKLGLKNTHFVTPNGLHDPDHYSTAYDMSIIGKNAFENKTILDTVEQKNYVFQTEDGLKIPIVSSNKLILNNISLYDSTCIGGKTGFTNQAGRCLVAIFNRDGRKIIGVVMNSKNEPSDTQASKDMEALINYSYSIKDTTLYSANDTLSTKSLTYKPFIFLGPTKTIEIPLKVSKNVQYYADDVNNKEKTISTTLNTTNPWKIKSNTSIGTLTLKERGVTKKYDIYTTVTTSDLISQNKLLYTITSIILLLVLMLAIRIRNVKKRRLRGRR